MVSLRASDQGKQQIEAAIIRRGRNRYDYQWLVEASYILDPDRPEGFYYEGFYANGCSLPTWKRFLQGTAIRCETFKAFCQVLELNWKEIYERNDLTTLLDPPCQPPVVPSFDIVRNPQESIAYQTILQPGSLLRIKGPQQSGKKRLLFRLLNEIKKEVNYRVIVFDCQTELDSTAFNSLDNFARVFCDSLHYLFELSGNLDDHWHKLKGTPSRKITTYFQTYILTQNTQPLVLVFESFDKIFQHLDVGNDFCSLLRGWHNKNAQNSELWQSLRIILVHSTDHYAIQNVNDSPLANVGTIIQLNDFSETQVNDLVSRYDLPLTNHEIDQLKKWLKEWLSGHPYLVNCALKNLKSQVFNLQQLQDTAATEEGIYCGHFRRLRGVIEQQPNLRETFQTVVTNDHAILLNRNALFQLDSMGLIRVQNNSAIIRCRLYQEYFRVYFLGEGE